jgi:hypothetical protein
MVTIEKTAGTSSSNTLLANWTGPKHKTFFYDPQVTPFPEPPRPKVVAGLITAASVRVEHAVSTINALQAPTGLDGYIVVSSGPYLDMGRNKVVRKFLSDEWSHADFLLMVDDDISYTVEGIDRLVEETVEYHRLTGVWPLTGGPYRGFSGSRENIIAYRKHPTDADPTRFEFRDLPLDEFTAADPDDFIDVDAFGTGFMLIHRSILDEMAHRFDAPQEWFIEGPAQGGDWFGEDLFFCMRAQALGHPILIHPAVRLVHYKEIGLAF